MSSIWYTSDLHLGHEKVSEIRGFEDTYDHDNTVVRNWKALIKPQDTVYVLGDLTCDQRKEEYALWVMNMLPGTKHLIAGNHDAVSSIHRNGWKRIPRYLEVFASVRDFAKVRMNKQDVLLSHYPYNGEGNRPGPDRYTEYRLRDEGVPLIHGHTHDASQRLHYGAAHSRWVVDEKGVETPEIHRAPQVHVGLDAWDMKPVRSDVVEKLLFQGEET